MPRQRNQIGFDMFPFLSVLCSVIGVMMLLIMLVMSTRVIEADEQVAAQEERRRVERPGDEDAVDEETYRQLEEEINRLTGQLATRVSERNELMRKEQQLIALIEEKRDALAIPDLIQRNPIDLDRPDPVAVIPDPDPRVTKDPIFVEVKAEGYLVHPDKVLYRPVEKTGSDENPTFRADRQLRAFLTQVDNNRDDEYLLLLVHPNGVHPFDNLRAYLESEFEGRISTGYEPFSRDWLFIAEQSGQD